MDRQEAENIINQNLKDNVERYITPEKARDAVKAALSYTDTKEDRANKVSDFSEIDDKHFPSTRAVENRYTRKNEIFINIKSFGAKGDGVTDDKDAFLNAVNAAKETGNALYVPKGDFLIDNVDEIDMTGVDRVICEGELILNVIADSEEPWRPVLKWEGTKKKIAENISVTKGGTSIVIPGGDNFKQGDTFFLVSLNNKVGAREDDFLGQRLTLYSFDPVSNTITFSERFDFDLIDAMLFWNDYNPNIVIDGLKVKGESMTYRTGVAFKYCSLVIENVNISNFSWSCLGIGSCYAIIKNYKADNSYSAGSLAAYGLVIGDLSLSYCCNLNLTGGRHAISHGGANTFMIEEIGDIPNGYTGAGFARFGAKSYVQDSYFSTIDLQAFDSHEVTTFVRAINCEIIGGCTSGATFSEYINCRIMQKDPVIKNELGRMPTEINVLFRGCSFVSNITSFFNLNTNIDILTFKDCCFFSNANSGSASFFVYKAHTIKNLNIINCRMDSNQVGNARRLNIESVRNIIIDGWTMTEGWGVYLAKYDERESIVLSNLYFENTGATLTIDEEVVPVFITNMISKDCLTFSNIRIAVSVKDIYIINFKQSGNIYPGGNAIRISSCENCYIVNSHFENNNSNDIRVEGSGNLILSNSIYTSISSNTTPNRYKSMCLENGSMVGV